MVLRESAGLVRKSIRFVHAVRPVIHKVDTFFPLKGPSVIKGICEKTKKRRFGEWGFSQVRFLKNYRCSPATECAALSSSLDARHFRLASMHSTLV